VAIYNNLVLAGSSFHVYERNGLWQLLFLEDTVGATSIVHDGPNFVIRNEYLDPGIWSCSLEPNGNLSFKSMDLDLKGYKISYNGEEVEIKDDLALVAVDYSYKCFLMKFENNKWNNIRQFGPESGESCSFDVLEITDQFLILGGYSDYSDRSIIYFINR
jgi:hypothetical protein